MESQPLRVVVWSTGWIGSIAIRTVQRRPDFELVGVWVHTPEKVGQDAGVLAGMEPIGLTVTDDFDALLALGPDCVVYAASGPEQDAAAVPDYVRFLDAGVNVVTVSSWSLLYPPGVDARMARPTHRSRRARRRIAVRLGHRTGFRRRSTPAACSRRSRNTITSIRSSELAMYDTYPVAFMMMDVMGFGRPLEYEPMLGLPGAQTSAWGPPIRLVAAGLGVELDEIREIFERRPTDRTLEVACGTIEAGTCGALRTQTIGVVDGKDAIVIEHVNRMAPDLAPEWPIGERDGTYRIIIEGDPDIHCEMSVGDPARRHRRRAWWPPRCGS